MYGLADVQGEARGQRVSMKSVTRVAPPAVEAKPTASITLEPVGRRARAPRQYAVRVILRFTGIAPQFADRAWVLGTARSAFAAASPAVAHEAPTFGNVRGNTSNVIGVEGVMVCLDKPMEGFFIGLREVLAAAGYGVVVQELRECCEPGCPTTALVDCARSGAVPGGWYAGHACGRHGYKSCARCSSTYVMSCSNATSAAPSVHCEVCGQILVEWGGTKLWTAELVARAEWSRAQ